MTSPLDLVLDYLASGQTEAEILVAHPQLLLEDVRACLAYGAELR